MGLDEVRWCPDGPGWKLQGSSGRMSFGFEWWRRSEQATRQTIIRPQIESGDWSRRRDGSAPERAPLSLNPDMRG